MRLGHSTRQTPRQTPTLTPTLTETSVADVVAANVTDTVAVTYGSFDATLAAVDAALVASGHYRGDVAKKLTSYPLHSTDVSSLAYNAKKRPASDDIVQSDREFRRRCKEEQRMSLSVDEESLICLLQHRVEKTISQEVWTFVNGIQFQQSPQKQYLGITTDDDMKLWRHFTVDRSMFSDRFESDMHCRLYSEREFTTINTIKKFMNPDGSYFFKGVQGTVDWEGYVVQESYGQIFTYDCFEMGPHRCFSYIRLDTDHVNFMVNRIRQNFNKIASSVSLRRFLELRDTHLSNEIGMPVNFPLCFRNLNREFGPIVKEFYMPAIARYITPLFNNIDDCLWAPCCFFDKDLMSC
jgi:hypothetical protein